MILGLQELDTMNLPVDLSNYDPFSLNSMLHQAETWVNGEARHKHGFTQSRVVDRVYGTGTNKLRSTYYPILTLNSIQIIFPPNAGNVNLPGPNQVPIDPSRVVIDYEAGLFYNWSPFVFQTIGYMTVFPEGVPINLDYYQGYIATTTTSAVRAGDTLVPVVNASCFHNAQTVRFYEDQAKEFITVVGATNGGGVPLVVLQDPLQNAHASGVTFGDMPEEIRQAQAYIVCDQAMRALNPEDLVSLQVDKVKKSYPLRTRPVAGQSDNSFLFEQEREFVKEARRLLEHFHSDRGIF